MLTIKLGLLVIPTSDRMNATNARACWTKTASPCQCVPKCCVDQGKEGEHNIDFTKPFTCPVLSFSPWSLYHHIYTSQHFQTCLVILDCCLNIIVLVFPTKYISFCLKLYKMNLSFLSMFIRLDQDIRMSRKNTFFF